MKTLLAVVFVVVSCFPHLCFAVGNCDMKGNCPTAGDVCDQNTGKCSAVVCGGLQEVCCASYSCKANGTQCDRQTLKCRYGLKGAACDGGTCNDPEWSKTGGPLACKNNFCEPSGSSSNTVATCQPCPGGNAGGAGCGMGACAGYGQIAYAPDNTKYCVKDFTACDCKNGQSNCTRLQNTTVSKTH